jgi:hypothetical protein
MKLQFSPLVNPPTAWLTKLSDYLIFVSPKGYAINMLVRCNLDHRPVPGLLLW